MLRSLRRRPRNRWWRALITTATLAAVTALAFILVRTDGPEDDPSSMKMDYGLRSFADCDELLASYRAGALASPGWYGGSDDEVLSDPPDFTDPLHLYHLAFNRENARIKGVEESDLAKSDGTHIFSMTSDSLVISEVRQNRGVHRTAEISLRRPARYARLHWPVRSELLLQNKTVLAVRSWTDFLYDGRARADVVQVFQIDVRDPNLPRIVHELTLDNTTLLTAWTMGGRAFMALWHEATGLELRAPSQMTEANDPEAAAREFNEHEVQRLGITAWQPRYRLFEGSAGSSSDGVAVPCRDTFFPGEAEWTPYATYVMSFDLGSGIDTWSSFAVLSEQFRVHAAEYAVYLASGRFSRTSRTQIHQFDWRPDSTYEHTGTAELDGELADKWPLDAHDGLLRVAMWSPVPAAEELDSWIAQIVVLRPGIDNVDGEKRRALKVVGSVDPTNGTGQIRHVRFAGSAAYVAPWIWDEELQSEDPLYVIDLSDASQPVVAATVRLPELSQNYPIFGNATFDPPYRQVMIDAGDDFVLMIGKQRSQVVLGTFDLLVSLFDIKEPLAPRLVETFTHQFGPSLAEWDERAALVADGVVWLPTESVCGRNVEGIDEWPAQFVGLRLSESGIEHEHSLLLLGCAEHPPWARALATHDQLQLISGFEIRTFALETGQELGLLDLRDQ